MSLTDLRDHLQALADAGQPLPIGARVIAGASLTPRAGLDDLLGSRLGLLGAIVDLLDGASPTDEVVLSGPVDPSDATGKAGPVPSMTLTAPITGRTIGVPKLELTAPRIELQSIADDSGRRLVWLTFATT